MTRMTFFWCATCLFGAGIYATRAWTQESALPNERPVANPAASGTRPVAVDVDLYGRQVPGNSSGSPFGLPGAGFPGAGVTTSRVEGPPHKARTVTRTVAEVVFEPMTAEDLSQIEVFQKALNAYKDSKDELGKKAASDIIQQQLTKSYEKDMAQREQELTSVEDRLKSLRTQLEKRKTAADDIISLRLKTIINNVEGLGFPGLEMPFTEPRATLFPAPGGVFSAPPTTALPPGTTSIENRFGPRPYDPLLVNPQVGEPRKEVPVRRPNDDGLPKR